MPVINKPSKQSIGWLLTAAVLFEVIGGHEWENTNLPDWTFQAFPLLYVITLLYCFRNLPYGKNSWKESWSWIIAVILHVLVIMAVIAGVVIAMLFTRAFIG